MVGSSGGDVGNVLQRYLMRSEQMNVVGVDAFYLILRPISNGIQSCMLEDRVVD